MNVAVDDRVREARRRLRQASDERTRTDPALRILTLTSPRTADAPLRLHTGLSVVHGLGEDARAALAVTVAGLFENAPHSGLDGTVLVDGRHQSIRSPRPPVATELAGARAMFGAEIPFALPTIGWAEESDLADLGGSIESAVRLTEAELRGADDEARRLRTEHTVVPEVIDLRVHENDHDEVRETLAAMEAMAPDPQVIGQLRDAHDRGADVAPQLAALGLDGAGDPHTVAAQALQESEELVAIRRRLEAQLAGVPSPSRATPGASLELQLLDARRTRLRRRLRSQRAFLAAAQDHLAFAADGVDPTLPSRLDAAAIPPNSGGRPLPLLVEDPLHDIPGRQGVSALAVLLRVSEMCQVICVSDEPELQDWTVAVGDRAQWIRATGWFAGEETC